MEAAVNLDEAYASFDEPWSPRIVARVNDYNVKLVHVAGEFVWHDHPDTDEFSMTASSHRDRRPGQPPTGTST